MTNLLHHSAHVILHCASWQARKRSRSIITQNIVWSKIIYCKSNWPSYKIFTQGKSTIYPLKNTSTRSKRDNLQHNFWISSRDSHLKHLHWPVRKTNALQPTVHFYSFHEFNSPSWKDKLQYNWFQKKK